MHWDKTGVTVGKIAKERLVTAPHETAQLFKRQMGTDDKIKIGKKKYSATELSAFVVSN